MLRHFEEDQRGGVAIIFAFAAMALFGSAGLALDYARAQAVQSKLQDAADAAALAGASAAATALSKSQRTAQAERFFNANSDTFSLSNLNVDISGNTATVSAAADVPTSLFSIIGIEALPVSVVAKAVAAGNLKTCVLLLEPTEVGLSANSGSYLNSNCGVQINSTNEKALTVNSQSGVYASGTCVSGQSFLNSGGVVSPAASIGCPTVADPLGGLAEPVEALGPCQFNSFTVDSFSVATMTPGVYCGNTVINSSASVTLSPGIYVFRDGEFLINSGSSATGSDILLFFQGANGRLNVNSDSQISIAGLRSGPYQGLVMFQSRDPVTLGGAPHIINSNSSSKIEGTIYAPNGALMFNSHSNANMEASYTAIIARKMDLNSVGTLMIKGYAGTGDTPETAALGYQLNPIARLVQ